MKRRCRLCDRWFLPELMARVLVGYLSGRRRWVRACVSCVDELGRKPRMGAAVLTIEYPR